VFEEVERPKVVYQGTQGKKNAKVSERKHELVDRCVLFMTTDYRPIISRVQSRGLHGYGSGGDCGVPAGIGTMLRFHRGDGGGQKYAKHPVGMESTTHGDTAV